MIGRGDGDGVNIFVLKQLTNIDVGFWLWQSQLLDVPEALVQHAFIHIAQSGNLRSWDTGKPVEVIFAATSHSANCHAHTIIRTHDTCVAGCRSAQSSAGYAGAGKFQKVPA
jgi:hypothetical protein